MKTCWKCCGKMVKQPKEFKQQKITYYKCENCNNITTTMPRNRSL